MTQEYEVYFNIDSRLLLQLGEKLVTNRAVALAELVKNSYDADATEVTVSLKNITKLGGTIIVRDNGYGMTVSTFKQTWMRIATIDKEKNPVSIKYKRQKAGEKGIGRFACRRLSKRLEIKSVAITEDGNKEEMTAIFDWASFTPGSDVDKVPVKYSTIPADSETPTGTTLILKDTKDIWDGWDIRRLRNELTDLISPTTFKTDYESEEVPSEYDPGFFIDFQCPEFPAKEDRLDKTFFNKAWAKLTGNVDGKGKATYKIKVLNPILNEIEKSYERTETFKDLRNTELENYFMVYDARFFRGSDWALGKAQEIGRERGGIKVYADNFRVFGYGEKGDDWLKLDYDRARSVGGVDKEVSGYLEVDDRPGLRRFRNQALFGHVKYLKIDNPKLEITVNRERLVDNEASVELSSFVRLGVDFATVLYANEVTRFGDLIKEKEELEEQARRKAEEELKKKADEERRNAEQQARRAEEEKKRAEERAIRAELERKKAEEELKKAEEERRRSEIERRKLEEEERIKKDELARKNLEEAFKKEKEHLLAEEEARKNEKEQKRKEEEIKLEIEVEQKKAEKSRLNKLEEIRRTDDELRKLKDEEHERKKEKLEREFSQLRVLASTGTLVLILNHELRGLVDAMEITNRNFSSVIKKLPSEEQEKYNEVLEIFNNRIEMVKEFGSFVGLTIGVESREKKQWLILPIIKNVFSPFKWYLSTFGVDYQITIPENLRARKMYRSELASIFVTIQIPSFQSCPSTQ